MKPKIYSICFLLFTLLFVVNVDSQPLQSGASLYPQLKGTREAMYAEVRAMPHSNEDSMRIIVMFRIQYDALLFMQNQSFKGQYASNPSIDIECRDTNGIIKYRSEWRDTIFARSFEQTNAEDQYAYGLHTFSIAKDHYTVHLSLYEKNGQSLKKIRIPKVYLPVIGIGQPIFTESNIHSEFVQPVVCNGNLPFSKNTQYAIFPLIGDIRGEIKASLKRLRSNEEYTKHVKLASATTVDIRDDVSLDLDPADVYHALMDSKLIFIPMNNQHVVSIQFPYNSIAPGRYSLTLFFSSDSKKRDSLVYDFSCNWESMPKTLISAQYALDIMKYILTDNQYDKMNSGSDIEIRTAIIDWWKKNDPTPMSIYDEAMYEYFRRADLAYTSFQTIQESDGVKTERGKIALLYGFPKSVERNVLSGNIQEEIWNYPDIVKKKFTFQQQSGGRFKLLKIESL